METQMYTLELTEFELDILYNLIEDMRDEMSAHIQEDAEILDNSIFVDNYKTLSHIAKVIETAVDENDSIEEDCACACEDTCDTSENYYELPPENENMNCEKSKQNTESFEDVIGYKFSNPELGKLANSIFQQYTPEEKKYVKEILSYLY